MERRDNRLGGFGPHLKPWKLYELCSYAVSVAGGNEMGMDGHEMGVGGPTHLLTDFHEI